MFGGAVAEMSGRASLEGFGRSVFDGLASDLLLEILGFLDSDVRSIVQFSLVCRRWSRACRDQGLWYRLCKRHCILPGNKQNLSEKGGGKSRNENEFCTVDWRRLYLSQSSKWNSFLERRTSLISWFGWWTAAILISFGLLIAAWYNIHRQASILGRSEIFRGAEGVFQLKNASIVTTTIEDSDGDISHVHRVEVEVLDLITQRIHHDIWAIEPWNLEYSYEEATSIIQQINPENKEEEVFFRDPISGRVYLINHVQLYPYICAVCFSTITAFFIMISSDSRNKQSIKPMGVVTDVVYRVFVPPINKWVYPIMDNRWISPQVKWMLNLVSFSVFHVFGTGAVVHYYYSRRKFSDNVIFALNSSLQHPSDPADSWYIILLFLFCFTLGSLPIRLVNIYLHHSLYIRECAIYSLSRAYFLLGHSQEVWIRLGLYRALEIKRISLELCLWEILEEEYLDSSRERRTRVIQRRLFQQEWIDAKPVRLFHPGDHAIGPFIVQIPHQTDTIRPSYYGQQHLYPKFVWGLSAKIEADSISTFSCFNAILVQ